MYCIDCKHMNTFQGRCEKKHIPVENRDECPEGTLCDGVDGDTVILDFNPCFRPSSIAAKVDQSIGAVTFSGVPVEKKTIYFYIDGQEMTCVIAPENSVDDISAKINVAIAANWGLSKVFCIGAQENYKESLNQYRFFHRFTTDRKKEFLDANDL